MSSGKTVLIYNPRAGGFERTKGGLAERVAAILRKAGHDLTIAPTTGPSTAGAIAREHIAAGAGLIVAAGGDGTINEVAEGMVESQTPLAILPGGTANVLATELKLGKNILTAASRLNELRPRRISVGHIACDSGAVSRHFLLMCGVGLDAHVVYHVHGPLKSATGKLAYWVAGSKLFGKVLPQIHAEADGKEYTCSFALLSKVRNYGGDFEIAREVTLYDDAFEAILFEGETSARYVRYLLATALGRLDSTKGVATLKTRCMRVSAAPGSRVYVQIDGEFVGCLPAEIRVVPDALTLLVPEAYGK